MRISDWSSDVCSSDLVAGSHHRHPGAHYRLVGALVLLKGYSHEEDITHWTDRTGNDWRRGRPGSWQFCTGSSGCYRKHATANPVCGRSEELRVGTECVRPCRSRQSPYP